MRHPSIQLTKSTLSRRSFASFSVGHVMNDMAAACWFTYLLVFLQKVPNLHSYEAAAVLLGARVVSHLDCDRV